MSARADRVVVITGASSGIGRATAHAFARTGARLVLVARGMPDLIEVCEECAALGSEAVPLSADISLERSNAAIASEALTRFGRLDVWVGAASVFAYGLVSQTPPDVFRRVLDVNLLGQILGARTALEVFSAKGEGSIILVGSVYSSVSTPYVSAYATAKHGLLGFANALRMEARPLGVRVSTVLPSTIDTPIYQHAANYTGRSVRPLPPAVDPERVARAIVSLADRPRAHVVVGQLQRGAIPAQRLLGRLYDRLALWSMNRIALGTDAVPPTEGTIFTPRPGSNSVTGGWR